CTLALSPIRDRLQPFRDLEGCVRLLPAGAVSGWACIHCTAPHFTAHATGGPHGSMHCVLRHKPRSPHCPRHDQPKGGREPLVTPTRAPPPGCPARGGRLSPPLQAGG